MKWVAAAVAASVMGWAMPATAQTTKTIQCWTDKSGQRMCGDRVPPEYAGQKRELMQGGRVVGTVSAAKTPEEIAEEKRKQQEAVEAQKRADYDRALLETYRSAKDIEAGRDERIALLDSRIYAAEKNSATTDKTLATLRARAEAQTKDGKAVDAKLAKQIKQYERDQKQNQRVIERNTKERAAIEQKFNADLARYYELRGGKPPEKAAPAAGAAAAATPAAAPAATPAEPAPADAPPAAKPAAAPAPAPATPPATKG